MIWFFLGLVLLPLVAYLLEPGNPNHKKRKR